MADFVCMSALVGDHRSGSKGFGGWAQTPHQISKVCMYVAGGSARPTVVALSRRPVTGLPGGHPSMHAVTGHTSCSSSERRLTACPDAKSSKATRHPNRRCSNPGEAQTSPEATLASSERSLVFTLSKSLKQIELSALALMSDMVTVRCIALCCVDDFSSWLLARAAVDTTVHTDPSAEIESFVW